MDAIPADPGWIAQLRTRAEPARAGGRVALIDSATRAGAAACVRTGAAVSLSRVLPTAHSGNERPDPRHHPSMRSRETVTDRLTVRFDQLETPTHSPLVTHLDGLNHYAVDGATYGGPAADIDRSVEAWGSTGIVTRAIHLDVGARRERGWVEAGEPVTGEELQSALDATGSNIRPGDALLVDMGRDRFEAVGGRYPRIPETGPEGRSGLGRSAAEWIADREVAVVCWDFLDAIGPTEPPAAVHLLIWALGLALVDSCEFAAAREVLASEGRHDGMLVIAPLRLPGASASPVNPLLVL